MIYCRYQWSGAPAWGIVEEHRIWEVTPDIFSSFEKTGKSFAFNEVQLMAPCVPSKIVAVGLNYKDHISEFGRTDIPTEPVLFLKAPSAVIGPDESIRVPKGIGRVDFEAEMAVVISRTARHVSEKDALDYVLGITCLNDVTARDLQKKDGQWARAKSFDTFCPIGPWISDGLPLDNLRVEACVNKRVLQAGHTSQMIFSVPQIMAHVTRAMTLFPGDIISTGTPNGVGPIQAGDVVEILVEGVGVLRNSVQEELS